MTPTMKSCFFSNGFVSIKPPLAVMSWCMYHQGDVLVGEFTSGEMFCGSQSAPTLRQAATKELEMAAADLALAISESKPLINLSRLAGRISAIVSALVATEPTP